MTEEQTTTSTMTAEEREHALGIRRFGGGQRCVVSHPDAGGPCEHEASLMVWELPFCTRHGDEAEASAIEELTENAEMELDALLRAEQARVGSNPVVLHALEEVETSANARAREARDPRANDAVLWAAYPPIEGRLHPDARSFDYDADYEGDGPVDWWAETRDLLCRFMRQAKGKGLPELARGLEFLREQASAQLVLAEDDLEARWTAPRRAARETSETR